MERNVEITPGVIVSKLNLKEDDTILITIDLDKYDLEEAHDIFKLIVNSFPNNNVVTTFNGVEITIGDKE